MQSVFSMKVIYTMTVLSSCIDLDHHMSLYPYQPSSSLSFDTFRIARPYPSLLASFSGFNISAFSSNHSGSALPTNASAEDTVRDYNAIQSSSTTLPENLFHCSAPASKTSCNCPPHPVQQTYERQKGRISIVY